MSSALVLASEALERAAQNQRQELVEAHATIDKYEARHMDVIKRQNEINSEHHEVIRLRDEMRAGIESTLKEAEIRLKEVKRSAGDSRLQAKKKLSEGLTNIVR